MKIKYLILLSFLLGSQVFAIEIINNTAIPLIVVTEKIKRDTYNTEQILPRQKKTLDKIFIQQNGPDYEILVSFNQSEFSPMKIFSSPITNDTKFNFYETEQEIGLAHFEGTDLKKVSTIKKSLIKELNNPTKAYESESEEKIKKNNQKRTLLNSKKVISAFGAAAVAGFVVFLISKYNNEPKKEKE